MARPQTICSPIELIEGRWVLRLLLDLKDGDRRFSDLKSALPRIAPNVLAERLRALERAGLIERYYLPPPSARHVYSLTQAGAELRPALDELASWQASSEL